MLEPYSSLLHHILNIVVANIDMLGVIMKYMILLQTNPTLVVT